MDTQPTPPPSAEDARLAGIKQCYVTALALMAKVGSGSLARAEPTDVQAFLRMLEDAHRFLDAGIPDSRQPAESGTPYDGQTDTGGSNVAPDV